MICEVYQSASLVFPPLTYDGSKAGLNDAILDFFGDDILEWGSSFWLAMAGLERWLAGDKITIEEILEAIAGETVTLKETWTTM